MFLNKFKSKELQKKQFLSTQKRQYKRSYKLRKQSMWRFKVKNLAKDNKESHMNHRVLKDQDN